LGRVERRRIVRSTTTIAEQGAKTHIVPYRFPLPAVRGIIARRVLINFRCDPAILAKMLPSPFRPKLVRGFGMAGICLIRLRGVRPSMFPIRAGLTSENAAHRIAIEWDDGGQRREGVFIPRRDTNSLLNRLAGGRLFPGVHHAAQFRVWETEGRIKIEMHSADAETFVRLAARVTDALPAHSVFHTLAEASDFFQAGALGWSARPESTTCDGLELRCFSWHMKPLVVERAESSFFNDANIFPTGTAECDSAFLMRDIEHEWHARGQCLTAPKDEL